MSGVGGGAATVILTADLVARAIIAAARIFGDDPVQAMTARRNSMERRVLSAAAGGLNRALKVRLERFDALLGVRPQTVRAARTKKGAVFAQAEQAAARAVAYAGWRPDARISVVSPPAPPAVAAVANAVRVRHPEVAAAPPTLSPTRFHPAWSPPPKAMANADRPVSDLLLEVLARGPAHTMNLALMIDRKEMAVVQTLSALAAARKVVSEPLADGPRRFRWKLVDEVAP